MARHAVPVGEGHALSLQCPCRPELAYTRAGEQRVPLVRHRSRPETATTARTARSAVPLEQDVGEGS